MKASEHFTWIYCTSMQKWSVAVRDCLKCIACFGCRETLNTILEENIWVNLCLIVILFFGCQQSAHKWVRCGLLKDKHREEMCVSLSGLLSPPRWLFTLGFITIPHLSEQFEAAMRTEQLSFPFSWLYKWRMDSSRLSQGVHSCPAWRHLLTNCHPPNHPWCH